jgi:signal peptidase I
LTDTIEPWAHPVDNGDDFPDVDSPDERSTIRRVVWFAAVVVGLLLVRTFLAEPVRVHGDSMQPTLRPGAVVVIDKVGYRFHDPRRGDVVVTSDPRNGVSIVKRVVAVGGDSVALENGSLVVNGVTVAETYIDNADMAGFYFGPDVVPEGDVFVLGDHRAVSVDSRTFGPIAVDSIEGRVSQQIWPLG